MTSKLFFSCEIALPILVILSSLAYLIHHPKFTCASAFCIQIIFFMLWQLACSVCRMEREIDLEEYEPFDEEGAVPWSSRE